MKRLGILALAAPSNGGTFQYTWSMLNALKRMNGFEATLYTAHGNHHYDDVGLPIRRMSLSRVDDLRLAALELARVTLADPFADEDILLAPIYSPILLHTQVPFAFTLHDLQERYLPHNFSVPQRLWRGFLQKRLCARASRIICESVFVQRDISRFFGVEPSRIAVLPSPPALSTGSPSDTLDAEETRTRLDLPDRFVFYPAQFWAHKNHARLVEAFSGLAARYPDVHLLFTGEKKDEFAAVFAKVKEYGLSDRIRHLGYVDKQTMAFLYRNALGLVMPSLFESVSIPVYEAQQAGTPVCASGILAIADQVGDSGLTFDPLSVDSIRAALDRLLGDEALRIRLGSAGRERFMSMGWDRYDERLAGLLMDLAAAPKAEVTAAQ